MHLTVAAEGSLSLTPDPGTDHVLAQRFNPLGLSHSPWILPAAWHVCLVAGGRIPELEPSWGGPPHPNRVPMRICTHPTNNPVPKEEAEHYTERRSDSVGKESACSAGNPGLIPRSGRFPGKEMATHSSILAWRIPWTEKPGGLQSVGVTESWAQLSK